MTKKVLMAVTALLFLLQTQPLFCACLTEGTPGGIMASSALPAKGDMPMKGCPCKGDDHSPAKADDGQCSLCHCLYTCPSEEQSNTIVSPGTPFSDAMLPATSVFPVLSLVTVRLIPNRGPLPAKRSDRPIHLLNNAFRF